MHTVSVDDLISLPFASEAAAQHAVDEARLYLSHAELSLKQKEHKMRALMLVLYRSCRCHTPCSR
ncbi:hypothetical protein CCP2SC5_470009 [Azospirillaceae bacterium]